MRRQEPVDELLTNVKWALSHDLDASELVPMLEKLVARSAPGSRQRCFGARQLAQLIVQDAPWRAALLAREVLSHEDDDRCWAVLGLAHSLLGNYRTAAAAYRRALALDPSHPAYAHNLGHLVDVAFGRPRDALRLLLQAHRALPGEEEVAASYAHALARSGDRRRAEDVLIRAIGGTREEAGAMLDEWLERGPGRSVGPPLD